MLGYIAMLLGFQLAGKRSGAFAALAMGLNGLLTAILLPLLWQLLT
jgi:putative effector of murein hydrolase